MPNLDFEIQELSIHIQFLAAVQKYRILPTRAQQAIEYTPKELIANKTFAQNGSSNTSKLLGYTEERQDSSGLVPGGFLTWFTWSIVPGICLGDITGVTKLWDLEVEEQE